MHRTLGSLGPLCLLSECYIKSYELHLLSNYGYERFALEVTKVSYLPRENSQETEENDDSKLENILHGVHLVVFIGVFVHQLSRAVGQELVLLDDDVPH